MIVTFMILPITERGRVDSKGADYNTGPLKEILIQPILPTCYKYLPSSNFANSIEVPPPTNYDDTGDNDETKLCFFSAETSSPNVFIK